MALQPPAQFRLWHILDIASSIHHGDIDSTFEGDDREGRFWSYDGSGNHQVAAWDASGLVAMAFDHDDPASEALLSAARRNPERLFEEAPDSLAPLVRSLIDWERSARLGTSSLWIATNQKGVERGTSGDEEALSGFEQGPDDVLEGWRRVFSLSKEQGRTAAKICEAGGHGPLSISEEQAVALLTPPTKKALSPVRPRVAAAVEAFAKLGIQWPNALETAARIEKDDDGASALLHACFDGDLDAVRAALAKGANIECSAREHQLPGRYQAGLYRPLTIAVGEGHREVAETLIEAGAVMDHVTLAAAAGTGRREMFELLLAKGCPIDPGELLITTIRAKQLDVLDLIFERAATLPPMPLGDFRTLTNIAETNSRPDLLERYPHTARLRAQREASDAREIRGYRAFPSLAAVRFRLLHLIHAVRGLHFDEERTQTHWEGPFAHGRYASSTEGGTHLAVAWSHVGLVGWAKRGLDAKCEPVPPEPTFTNAPSAIRGLYTDLSQWVYAPKLCHEARWVDPHGAQLRDMTGDFSADEARRELWFHDYAHKTPPGERIPWPRAAFELATETVKVLSRISFATIEGEYELTPEDIAQIVGRQKAKGKKVEIAPERLEDAARRFGEIGVRWQVG